jgi:hypothetical protein
MEAPYGMFSQPTVLVGLRMITSRSLVLLLLFLQNGWSFADVKRAGDDNKKVRVTTTAPEANDVSAKFVVGQSVVIELAASIGSLKRVEFMIRQAPQHGTLSPFVLHPKDNNKVLVTYTHKDASAPPTDFFTYACRLEGGSISAPATVSLNGQRFDPQLEVVTTPQFGRVFLGGEATEMVRVQNKGPAAYKSPLNWEAPWKGPPSLEVAPGATAEFLVTFKPEKAGSFRSQRELQPGLTLSNLYLYGDCVEVLTVSPGRLVLNHSSTTGERSGVLTVVNALSDPAVVNLKLPERLQGPTTVELDPLGKAEIVLKLPAADVKVFQESVSLETRGMIEKSLVVADASPGEMKLVSPAEGVLDFGSVVKGHKASANVTLANIGGQPVIIGVKSVVPFMTEAAGQALRLEPGQQRALNIEMKTDRTGRHASALVISGGETEISVSLRGQVRETTGDALPDESPMASAAPNPTDTAPESRPAIPAASAITPTTPAIGGPLPPGSQRTPAQAAVMAYLASSGMPVADKFTNAYLDQVTDIFGVDHTSNSITLAWKRPSVAPAGWRLEQSDTVLVKDQGAFVKVWKNFPNWKLVEGDPEKITVRLHSLQPAAQYELRIFAMDREGKLSKSSPVVVAETAQSWSIPSWVWRVLVIGALAIMIYVLHKIRRGEFEFEF